MPSETARIEENVTRSTGFGLFLRASIGLLLLVLLAGGCASTSAVPTSPAVGAAGPGTLFVSMEAAVLDALAWSYHESLEQPRPLRRTRAGTVRLVAGGYTYDAPAVAPKNDPHRVSYRLTEDSVAHYRMNPQSGTGNDQLQRALEIFSARDRDLVDRHDQRHRPMYMLTPSLRIRSYSGKQAGPRIIARLNRERGTDGVIFSLVQAD